MNPKEDREKRASLHSQMTALVDKAKAEKRQMTAEENETFDRIDADIVQLSANIERMDRMEKHNATLTKIDPVALVDINARNTKNPKGTAEEYNKVFSRYLRVGTGGLSPEETAMLSVYMDRQAALTPATGSGGGYLIPTGFSDKLEEARKWFGGIVEVAETITTGSGNPIPWPSSNDTSNVGEIIGPNTQTTQAFPTFGNVIFNAYKFSSKLVPVPLELVQDTFFNLDVTLPKWLGERIARIENTKFTVGSGTNEPTGLVTAAAGAGLVVQMATGNVATISVDNFTDLEHAVDRAYRVKAKYMLHDQTLKLVKKLKDADGRSLWLPGLASSLVGGFPSTINGYPYVINNDMPVPGASNYIVAFGELSAFKIRRVEGYYAMRLTERFADYFQVGYLAGERADSNLVDAGTHPIALLQNSAT